MVFTTELEEYDAYTDLSSADRAAPDSSFFADGDMEAQRSLEEQEPVFVPGNNTNGLAAGWYGWYQTRHSSVARLVRVPAKPPDPGALGFDPYDTTRFKLQVADSASASASTLSAHVPAVAVRASHASHASEEEVRRAWAGTNTRFFLPASKTKDKLAKCRRPAGWFDTEYSKCL